MVDPVPHPLITARTDTRVSPWVMLRSKTVALPGQQPGDYHSLALDDYITVLALTPAREVVLVRQFRPALERETLELPGGLVDDDLAPDQAIARELEEEAGFQLRGAPTLLGSFSPDTGRLENRLIGFFADDLLPVENWQPEPGVERVLMPLGSFLDLVRAGDFEPALHVALVGSALLRGLIAPEGK
jgi:8-oxo-dGTP pyrophosphatase MutT (NUDIX family)